METMGRLFGLVLASLLAGILLPIGLGGLVDISNANVSAGVTFGSIAPASIITLLGTVLPIVIVIVIIMDFLRG